MSPSVRSTVPRVCHHVPRSKAAAGLAKEPTVEGAVASSGRPVLSQRTVQGPKPCSVMRSAETAKSAAATSGATSSRSLPPRSRSDTAPSRTLTPRLEAPQQHGARGAGGSSASGGQRPCRLPVVVPGAGKPSEAATDGFSAVGDSPANASVAVDPLEDSNALPADALTPTAPSYPPRRIAAKHPRRNYLRTLSSRETADVTTENAAAGAVASEVCEHEDQAEANREANALVSDKGLPDADSNSKPFTTTTSVVDNSLFQTRLEEVLSLRKELERRRSRDLVVHACDGHTVARTTEESTEGKTAAAITTALPLPQAACSRSGPLEAGVMEEKAEATGSGSAGISTSVLPSLSAASEGAAISDTPLEASEPAEADEATAKASRLAQTAQRATTGAEQKIRAEAESIALEQAEQQAAAEEAERKARMQAEVIALEQAAQQAAREEAERKARVEAERIAFEQAVQQIAKEEAERKARAKAERIACEQTVQRVKDETDQKARAEAEHIASEQAAQGAKDEAERQARAEAERSASEQAAQRDQEEATQKGRAEAKRTDSEKAAERATEEAEQNSRVEAKTQISGCVPPEAVPNGKPVATAITTDAVDERPPLQTRLQEVLALRKHLEQRLCGANNCDEIFVPDSDGPTMPTATKGKTDAKTVAIGQLQSVAAVLEEAGQRRCDEMHRELEHQQCGAGRNEGHLAILVVDCAGRLAMAETTGVVQNKEAEAQAQAATRQDAALPVPCGLPAILAPVVGAQAQKETETEAATCAASTREAAVYGTPCQLSATVSTRPVQGLDEEHHIMVRCRGLNTTHVQSSGMSRDELSFLGHRGEDAAGAGGRATAAQVRAEDALKRMSNAKLAFDDLAQSSIEQSAIVCSADTKAKLGRTHFSMHDGCISQGGDLWRAVMTVRAAKKNAAQIPGCKGFCFQGMDSGQPLEIFFKAKFDNEIRADQWTSYRCEEEWGQDGRPTESNACAGARSALQGPQRHHVIRNQIGFNRIGRKPVGCEPEGAYCGEQRLGTNFTERFGRDKPVAESKNQVGATHPQWTSSPAAAQTSAMVPRERGEQDGCFFWEVLLIQESGEGNFGLTTSDGQRYVEEALGTWRCSRCASGPNGMPPCRHCPQNDPSKGVGMSVQGPSELIVWDINQGAPLQRWNSLYPWLAVESGDRIIGANGESSVDGMLDQIAKSARVRLVMKRYPELFAVSFVKDDRGLGLRCPLQCHCPNRRLQSLVITELLPSGIVPDHNAQNAKRGGWQQVVLQGMEIERVNGVVGDALAMAEELRSCMQITMHVRRGEKAKNLHLWNCMSATSYEAARYAQDA